MEEYDIVVIGGGSAGIAAAISAYENGCHSILLLEKEFELGGILLQCIHNGFGLHRFHEELTGPAYAEKWTDILKNTNVTIKTKTTVVHLDSKKHITYVNAEEGYVTIHAKAVILATGCRERTRGAIAIPGYRPSGIWTAGTAQRYLNMEGYLIGKRVFILGSGDIGLIMARRMTLEGAKVLGVAEIMPYSNGLPRNIKQCLEDFDIPLYLSHTVTDIKGRNRLSSVTISKVDDNLQKINGTEKTFTVDTLLLSVGLIPDNTLSEEAGIKLLSKTKGPEVDESMQTSISGVFSCGNGLHVHDLVDYVSLEGERAGKSAAHYVKHEWKESNVMNIKALNGIQYVLPVCIHLSRVEDAVELMFRVNQNKRDAKIMIMAEDKVLKEIRRPHVSPSEMEKIILKKQELDSINQMGTKELTISLQ